GGPRGRRSDALEHRHRAAILQIARLDRHRRPRSMGGHDGLSDAEDAWRLELALHHDHIEPAVEFEADALVTADEAEAVAAVELYRVLALARDAGDHLVEAGAFCLGNQPAEQRAAMPSPHSIAVQVDRVFARVTIGSAW